MRYLGIIIKIPIFWGVPKVERMDSDFRRALAHKISSEYGLRLNKVQKTVNDYHRWWFKNKPTPSENETDKEGK